MNLYGWLVKSVIASNSGLDINTPEIIIDTVFAYLLFFEIKYKPAIVGIKNAMINPSYLIWYDNDTNPFQNPFQSQSCPWFPTTLNPKIIIMTIDDARIIFFFIEISEFKIKNIDIGKNVAESGFEDMETINAIGDKNHVLWNVKYNETR